MRIVLVDDERFSLKWMEKMVSQLGSGYEVVGSFINGSEALTYCLANPVDVLLTDIRMPVMDGLELIRMLKKKKSSIHPVIISAYDEFDYAREAMKLGVTEFLIKAEITRESLNATLRSIAEQLESNERNMMLEQWAEWREQLLNNQLSEDECDRIAQQCGAESMDEACTVAIVSVRESTQIREMWQALQTFIQGVDCRASCIQISRRRLMCVMFSLEDYGDALREMGEALAKFFPNSMAIGYSFHQEGERSLITAIRHAYMVCDLLRYYDRHCVEAWKPAYEREQNVAKARHIAVKSLHSRHGEEVISALDMLFLCAQESLFSLGALYGMANSMLDEIYSWAAETENSGKQMIWPELHPYEGFALYKSKVMQIAAQMIQEIEQNVKKNMYSPSVLSIIQYLEEHYCEEVSLDSISQAVHLNKTYISTAFKRETGENVSDCLQRLRVQRAEQLLEKSAMSIREIAQYVKIDDPAYFAKVFRKYKGMTPTDYRNSIRF